MQAGGELPVSVVDGLFDPRKTRPVYRPLRGPGGRNLEVPCRRRRTGSTRIGVRLHRILVFLTSQNWAPTNTGRQIAAARVCEAP